MLLLLFYSLQWDICTGWRCPAKKGVFGSLSNFLLPRKRRSGLNRISHSDWVKLCVELNCAPNQNTKFPFHYRLFNLPSSSVRAKGFVPSHVTSSVAFQSPEILSSSITGHHPQPIDNLVICLMTYQPLMGYLMPKFNSIHVRLQP